LIKLNKNAIVVRSKRCGTYSIEAVFDSISGSRELSGIVDVVHLPFPSSNVFYMCINVLCFFYWSLRYDVLHMSGDAHYVVLGAIRRNVILTIHDAYIVTRGRGMKLRILKLLWLKWPIAWCRNVTVISEATKAAVLSEVKTRKLLNVIPNPVGCGYVYSPKEMHFPPRVLQIGTNPHKNLSRVVAALSGLDCKLVIVGKMVDSIERDLVLSGIDYVWKSDLKSDELFGEYCDADVISFPSLFEGFGMPIIEGQAVGRVVVTSDIEPIRSVCGNAAILVDPLDVNSIRNGFVQAFSNEILRKEKIVYGLENVKKYDVEVIAKKYKAMYFGAQGELA